MQGMPRYSLRYLLLETCAFGMLFATWHWVRMWKHTDHTPGTLLFALWALVIFAGAAVGGIGGPKSMRWGGWIGFSIATVLAILISAARSHN